MVARTELHQIQLIIRRTVVVPIRTALPKLHVKIQHKPWVGSVRTCTRSSSTIQTSASPAIDYTRPELKCEKGVRWA